MTSLSMPTRCEATACQQRDCELSAAERPEGPLSLRQAPPDVGFKAGGRASRPPGWRVARASQVRWHYPTAG
jgi:hypothetical protein